ncbi:MAG: (d)CMP kinase, partial [Bacteroidales bacterium]|nr:(d)CMP kinase [Bacteroidales bacterium]
MTHISITGDLGSGKSSVAKILCQDLGFEYFSTGSLQRKLAAEKGMNTLDMNKFSEST